MRSTGIKLATFTIFTIIITFGLASLIGNLSFFGNAYSVNAVFSDATGVLNGDLVKVAGVTVGKVTGFRTEGGEAVITMEIEGDVELPENAGAEIKFRNLLGQRIVQLTEPEEPSEELLEDGDTIPVERTDPALDLAIVFNNIRPLIQTTNPEDINTVARGVLEVFKGRKGDFAQILENVGTISKTLSGKDGRFVRLIGDLDELTKLLNSQAGSIRTSLTQFADFMEDLGEITPEIERAIVRLDAFSARFGNFVADNKIPITEDLEDLAAVLNVVGENLGPLDRAARHLKEVLLATGRSQSYGRWWNLYVVNLCPEVPTGMCNGLFAGGR